MNAVVKAIAPGSPAEKAMIKPGDTLRKINGNIIGDFLDYKFHSYESRLLVELKNARGKLKFVRLRKSEGADLGIEFDTFLMDDERSCVNKCIFCFIDQLPKGMRKSLYYKDDDVRLSFLQGNYITLSNLTDYDVKRIIKLNISPINVSIHSTNPKLRAFMLGGRRKDTGLKAFKALADANITLNCQIVCCPGINDGRHLDETMLYLLKLGFCINSVSIVPVGLTKHRANLHELRTFDKQSAIRTIAQVDKLGDYCLKKRGRRVFYSADELYIKAGLALPSDEYYDDYPQLENGVGMMRLFMTEFIDELENMPKLHSDTDFLIITGKTAAPYLTQLLNSAREKYDTLKGDVFAVENDFFGNTVTVSGLITGGDILNQLGGRGELAPKIIIPRNMLRSGEEVFLDDVTVSQLGEKLGVCARVANQDGADLLRAMLE